MHNVQHPSRLRFFPDTTQIDALREKLCVLQDFLKLHSSTTEDIECTVIVRKIPRVTYEAEILIHSFVVDQLYGEFYPQSRVIQKINLLLKKINDFVCRNLDFHYEIHRVIEEIESIKEALNTIQNDHQEQPTVVLDKFTGSKPLTNKTVGFDDQLIQVLEKLTGKQPNLVIVPIVGMGGIGKTTLARSLFDHPYNIHYFSVRIWITISQDYSIRKVLQELLKDGVLGEKDIELGDESILPKLITQLHRKLFGQRYLIVLDDVWSLEASYALKGCFPHLKDNNSSFSRRARFWRSKHDQSCNNSSSLL